MTDIAAFRAFVERVEGCWPNVLDPIKAYVARELDGSFIAEHGTHSFSLHGVSATSFFGDKAAARFWLFRARNLLGGFPEPAYTPLPLREWQLEWAQAHVTATRPENDALLAQACAIVLALSADLPLRARAGAWQDILNPDPKGRS